MSVEGVKGLTQSCAGHLQSLLCLLELAIPIRRMMGLGRRQDFLVGDDSGLGVVVVEGGELWLKITLRAC